MNKLVQINEDDLAELNSTHLIVELSYKASQKLLQQIIILFADHKLEQLQILKMSNNILWEIQFIGKIITTPKANDPIIVVEQQLADIYWPLSDKTTSFTETSPKTLIKILELLILRCNRSLRHPYEIWKQKGPLLHNSLIRIMECISIIRQLIPAIDQSRYDYEDFAITALSVDVHIYECDMSKVTNSIS